MRIMFKKSAFLRFVFSIKCELFSGNIEIKPFFKTSKKILKKMRTFYRQNTNFYI